MMMLMVVACVFASRVESADCREKVCWFVGIGGFAMYWRCVCGLG